jgi:hypothetical protein
MTLEKCYTPGTYRGSSRVAAQGTVNAGHYAVIECPDRLGCVSIMCHIVASPANYSICASNSPSASGDGDAAVWYKAEGKTNLTEDNTDTYTACCMAYRISVESGTVDFEMVGQ